MYSTSFCIYMKVWSLTETMGKKVEALEMGDYQRTLIISWEIRMTNEQILPRPKQENRSM